MRRYRVKNEIRSVRVKLLPGAFVEVVSPPRYDWHSVYIGITGSVVRETTTGIYEVQFGEEGAGSFSPESLRLV